MNTQATVSNTGNPIIAPLLRAVYILIAVVVIAGASLFFVPGLMVPRWPWPLAPFNTSFLGTIYVVELVAVTIAVINNRWSPARLVLPISFTFALVITAVSFFYLGRFDTQKWSTYVWFVLYIVGIAVFGYYLWFYRNQPPAETVPVPPAWRTYFMVEGVVYGLYGIGLVALPDTFSAFWPWKIDDFHARLYSAIFIGLAVGMLTLVRAASSMELITMGLTQGILAVFGILGLIIVDASAHRVDWSAPGTWLWIAGLGVLIVAGLGMARLATQLQARPAMTPA
jgi:heme/copper-type cytochrome/quinol oxidase subunit 4